MTFHVTKTKSLSLTHGISCVEQIINAITFIQKINLVMRNYNCMSV
jgi:hypothetical protein